MLKTGKREHIIKFWSKLETDDRYNPISKINWTSTILNAVLIVQYRWFNISAKWDLAFV